MQLVGTRGDTPDSQWRFAVGTRGDTPGNTRGHTRNSWRFRRRASGTSRITSGTHSYVRTSGDTQDFRGLPGTSGDTQDFRGHTGLPGTHRTSGDTQLAGTLQDTQFSPRSTLRGDQVSWGAWGGCGFGGEHAGTHQEFVAIQTKGVRDLPDYVRDTQLRQDFRGHTGLPGTHRTSGDTQLAGTLQDTQFSPRSTLRGDQVSWGAWGGCGFGAAGRGREMGNGRRMACFFRA